MSLLNALTINNVLIFLITFIFVLYLYFKRSYTYWSRRGVITPTCSFPLGNLNEVIFGRVSLQEMFKQMYTDLKSKGKRYFGYYLLHQPVLVVIDLELIKSIMIKDFAHFTDHGLFEKQDYDTFGGDLFNLKGAEWKAMREKLSPLFTSGKLKMMFPTIQHCCAQLASLVNEAADNSEILNMADVAARYTIDIIASIGFGIESNTLKDPASDFRKYGELAVGRGSVLNELRLTMHSLMPALTIFLKMPIYPPKVSKFFLEIVQSTINYREENNVVRKDFMQLMIQLKNNVDISDGNDENCFDLKADVNDKNMNNKKNLSLLSIEQIVAQALLFFTAGYDTSAMTISFCMYELAFHQDIQEKLRDEIKTVLNNELDEKPSYNAIKEMTYMDQCIKETLRKYPVLSSLFRRCTATYQVPNSDLIIEKDTILYIPINEVHYDPEYYPNPEKFDPERFSNENIAKRKNFTWLPFGEGPRTCIGARLAMLDIKIALTTFLKDFRYSSNSKTEYPLKRAPMSVMAGAEGGIWLNVEKIMK